MIARARTDLSYLCEDEDSLYIPGRSLARIALMLSGQLDRAICPRCGGPLAARQGRRGPYFQCLCPEGRRRTEGVSGEW